MRKHSRFTLVEMLVVIAIIGVLAALLMPALQNALAAGRQVSCANNLKNCFVGLCNYGNDYNGFLIRGLTAADGNKSMWPGYTTGYYSYNSSGNRVSNAGQTTYIKVGDRVLDCPARPQISPTIGQGNQGYGMPEAEGSTANIRKLNYLTSTRVNGTSGTLKLLALQRVTKPGRSLLLADTTSANASWRYGSQQQGSLACFSNWAKSGNYDGIMQMYHSEQANGLFIDGHVESRDAGRWYLDPETHVRQVMSQDFTVLPQMPDY